MSKSGEMVVLSETLGPPITESFLPEQPAATEQQHTHLSWSEENGIWYADGPAEGERSLYHCEQEDGPDGDWAAIGRDGVSSLGSDPDLAAAQALCQAHYDGALQPAATEQLVKADPDGEKRQAKRLKWRCTEKGQRWQSTKGTGYEIERSDDGRHMKCTKGDWVELVETKNGWTLPQHCQHAKAACEKHYEAQPGDTERDTKPEKPKAPPGKLGDYTIPVQMTPAELDALSLELAAAVMKIRRLNREIDDIKDDAKRRVKTRQEQIETLEGETEEQARKREAEAEDREVRCYRAVEGDEIAYYNADGQELHRHRARLGEQQGLFGGTPTGKTREPDEWIYDTTRERDDVGLFAAGGGVRAQLIAELLARPWPEEPEPTTDWPWGELSWHPLVASRQLALGWKPARGRASTMAAPLEWVQTPGDPDQLFARCGRYHVRPDSTSGFWLALHGEDLLWTKDEENAYPSPDAAQQRCQDHAAAMAATEQRAAEARAIHEGRTKPGNPPPLKWRKTRGSDEWNAGPYTIRGPVNGYLEVSHGGQGIGLIPYVEGVSQRTNLERAKGHAERHRNGERP